MLYKIVLFISYLVYCDALYEGDFCVKDGQTGTCSIIFKCKSALEGLKRRQSPQTCGFIGPQPIVCCLENLVNTQLIPVATTTTTTKPPQTSTAMYIPNEEDYVQTDEKSGDGCLPISPEMTSQKTGQKAFDKCIEYQEKYVYPCERGVALTGKLSRSNHCHHNADQLIVGGNDTTKNEFPHMVMLGYGDNLSSVDWLCGGSIISERFILTAGHCISTRDKGEVKYIVTGAYTRSDAQKMSNIYKVKRIIKYPEYRPPSKYNDIALLEIVDTLKLNHETVPACLHAVDPEEVKKVIATGWGLTSYGGTTSEVMQKVILHKFTNEECMDTFTPHRLMKIGYDVRTQICYGEKTQSRDTCQGDSGGPIQVKSKKIHCMYVIVGLTSFGKGCGLVGEPAIYTRVSSYVPWIEGIVWA